MQRVGDALGVVRIYDERTSTKRRRAPGEFRVNQNTRRGVVPPRRLACAEHFCQIGPDGLEIEEETNPLVETIHEDGVNARHARDAATYKRRTPSPRD